MRARNKYREEQNQNRSIQSAITDGIEAALKNSTLCNQEVEAETQADLTGNKRAIVSAGSIKEKEEWRLT